MDGGGVNIKSVPPTRSVAPRAGWSRRAVWWLIPIGLLAACCASFVDDVRSNFHQVVSGRAFRCGQLSPDVLRGRVAIHRIRSIVNLRGPNPQHAWYQEERAAARELGVEVYDIGISSKAAPISGELHLLVRAFVDCPKPVLIHCESGLDRTGLGSAIYLLALEDCTVERAKQQMSLRYGIPPWRERTQRHLQFIEMYESWLDEQGLDHANEDFLRWATEVYVRPEQLGGPDWTTVNSPNPPPSEPLQPLKSAPSASR